MTTKKTKPIRPFVKNNLIQTRVNNDELQTILTKALVYDGGNLSKYVRRACLEHRPLKRVAK